MEPLEGSLKVKSRVYLSRRNLLTLLSKLDRKAAGQQTECTIIKRDNAHPVYAQTMKAIEIVAVEDEAYYTQRDPGPVFEGDTPNRELALVVLKLKNGECLNEQERALVEGFLSIFGIN